MYINDIPNDTDDIMDKSNDFPNNNKEENQINNIELKENICDSVVAMLLNLKAINSIEEIGGIQIQFGYIFTKENGELEALLKATYKEKVYYLAVQHGNILLLNMDEKLFINTILKTRTYHKCLENSEISIMTLKGPKETIIE